MTDDELIERREQITERLNLMVCCGCLDDEWPPLRKVATQLIDAQAARMERLHRALETIKHSIGQARIGGNDWRRELALIENTVDAALIQSGRAIK